VRARAIPGVAPITDEERQARIEKARRLMIENKIAAIFLEPGTSMYYFAGVRWGIKRADVRHGDSGQGRDRLRRPGFEEARAKELIRFGRTFAFGRKTKAPARSWPGC